MADPTVAEFRAAFGSAFATTPEPLIAMRLALAIERTPADVWTGEQTRRAGILYLTAHLCAMEPGAREMRKGEKPGETLYGRERERLELFVSSGFRVAGLSTLASADPDDYA